ncbi:hypothetical protein F5Y12DRAFT_775955 [Xylaria sp. FL1777]|nr:hypothetical protein F5Y12DRAFT_775955 [Xylaria sp. FL1777]
MSVIIFHPIGTAGGLPSNPLLKFPALDKYLVTTSGPKLVWGMDYQTALIACGILAGSRWDGFFTKVYDDTLVTETEFLEPGPYYFKLPASDDPASDDATNDYPIVASFNEWLFPHGNLPKRWRFSIPADQPNDAYCIMTSTTSGLHKAHIIPEAKSEWWNQNNMAKFALSDSLSTITTTSNEFNLINLCSDFHYLMDQNKFCIIPKLSVLYFEEPADVGTYNLVPPDPSVRLVMHVLEPDSEYELFEYHNACLPPLTGIKPEYLFAAFAEKIFKISLYHKSYGSKKLMLVSQSGDRERVYERKDVVLRQVNKSPRERAPFASVSSLKRSRGESDDDDYYYSNISKKRKGNRDPTEEERGRTLRREGSPVDVHNPSTVTSVGARIPSSERMNGGYDKKYSYYITITDPTEEDSTEEEYDLVW